MSNTWDKIENLHEMNGIFQFKLGERIIDKSAEIRKSAIEEIQEELTNEEPKITGIGPLVTSVLQNNDIEQLINDLIAIGMNNGYAAVVPVRLTYFDYILQAASIHGKPKTIGNKLAQITVKTSENVDGQLIDVYATYSLNNAIQGYQVIYQAFIGKREINVNTALPKLGLDENGIKLVPKQTRIPVSIFKINKNGESPFQTFATSLSIINFYAAHELDDAELSKLKILVNGNILKWGEAEAGQKLRKGGVIKMGASKSYTYANPFTVVAAAANTTQIIDARKEHEQAFLNALGINPIIETKKAQQGQAEHDKNDRTMNRKQKTRKRNLIKTLKDIIIILAMLLEENLEDSFSIDIVTFLEEERKKSLEEAAIRANSKNKPNGEEEEPEGDK